MIVAVAIMRMVQASFHQIVHVFTMRNCLMTAFRPVQMVGFVAADGLAARAFIRIARVDFQRVLFDLIAAYRVVQMTVVQIVGMPVVFNRDVAAVGSVRVVVIGMGSAHFC